MTKLGVQIQPWSDARRLVEVGRKLSDVVDLVWIPDQILARHVYTLLGALAQAGCGVGTAVTFPVGRNPIEMASAIATIGELVPDDREIVVGMGTGGVLVSSLFRKHKPVSAVREAIMLMRALWTGEPVQLDDFPVFGAALDFGTGATAQLTYPVRRRPDIVVAGVGPKILAVAAEHADGLMSPGFMPTLSRAALLSGRFGEVSGLDNVLAARPAGSDPMRMVFGINISISQDRERAREYARRQVALLVGNPKFWPDLAALGLDIESAGEVKAAFDKGLGVEGAAQHCSESLADALIISGSPEDCIGPVIELRDLAAAHGYSEFYLGVPLGPDPAEAADLLLTVIPEVWPDRRGGRR